MRVARTRTVRVHADDESALARLRALGASRFVHVNGTLERHLRGTQRLLRNWGSRDPLCLAGLYHAVYGTDGITGRLVELDARDAVAKVIGDEAERAVYVYAACARDGFHPRIGTPMQNVFVDRFADSEYPITDCELRDFCELTIANELELALSSTSFKLRHRRDLSELFARMGDLASDAARAAASRVLQPRKVR
jgi:hypothetical protein